MPQFRIVLEMERRLLLVLGRFCLTTRGLVSACQHQIGTWCLSSTHARSRPTGAPPSLSVPDLGLGHQPRLESSQGRSNAADRVCAAATTLLCIACSSTMQCAAAVERATPETGRCAFKEVRACKWATPLLVYWLFRRRGEIVKDFLLAFSWDFGWDGKYLHLNI